MAANKRNGNPEGQPFVVIEGMEEIIKKDLQKHKNILDRLIDDLYAFRRALSHEIKKKKYYKSLIGQGKYDDKSLIKSMDQMRVNIQHFHDKIKITNAKIDHNKLIVETLTGQLDEQMKNIDRLNDIKKKELNATKH